MRDFIERIIKEAGQICLDEQGQLRQGDIGYKGPRDLVTPVDRAVERFLVKRIRAEYPGHDIIGEEDGEQVSGSRWCWIIDPIDGTTSYCHGLPSFSVSIALRTDGELTHGAVYAPALAQLFQAERGQGARLNGKRMRVSSCRTLSSALLATGFACLRDERLERNNLFYLNRLLPKIRDIRRCGSAALDLAWVAAGKMDGFWEMNLNIYDVAAGVLLVREAGGTVSDFSGAADFPEKGIIASNFYLTAPLLENLSPDA